MSSVRQWVRNIWFEVAHGPSQRDYMSWSRLNATGHAVEAMLRKEEFTLMDARQARERITLVQLQDSEGSFNLVEHSAHELSCGSQQADLKCGLSRC